MAFNPGPITPNRVPELMLAGAQAQGQMYAGLGKTLGQGIEQFAQRREAAKDAEATAKALDTIIRKNAKDFGFETGTPEGEDAMEAFLTRGPDESAIAWNSKLKNFLGATITASQIKEAQQQQALRQQQLEAAKAQQVQQAKDAAFVGEFFKKLGTPQQTNVTSPAGQAILQGGFGADIQGLPTNDRTIQTTPSIREALAGAIASGNIPSPQAVDRVDSMTKLLAPTQTRGVQTGKTPSGMEYIIDEKGGVHFPPKGESSALEREYTVRINPATGQKEYTPIPGTPAAISAAEFGLKKEAKELDISTKKKKDEEARQKAQERAENALESLDRTISTVDEALKLAKKGAAGIGNQAIGWATQSGDAKRLNTRIQTIKSAQALQQMQELKELSKTGATGFGSLTAPELAVLQNSIAELSPWMSDEITTENLRKIRNALLKARGRKVPTDDEDSADEDASSAPPQLGVGIGGMSVSSRNPAGIRAIKPVGTK